MNNLFFELFHSKNGQLKCPNTKLLSLLVTADEDCRLIFSIWWINKADQHETEIQQILSKTMSFFGRLRQAKTSSSQERKSHSSGDGIKNASVRNLSFFYFQTESVKISFLVISLPYHLSLIVNLVFDIIIP